MSQLPSEDLLGRLVTIVHDHIRKPGLKANIAGLGLVDLAEEAARLLDGGGDLASKLPTDEIEMALLVQRIAKLRTWSELSEPIQLPPAIAAAVSSGRPELVRLQPAVALDEDQVGKLLHAIAVMLETNYLLQMHARLLSRQTTSLMEQMTGLNRGLRRLAETANFRQGDA